MTIEEYREAQRDQRMRALDHANEVRSARKAIKAQLKTHELELAALIAQPPPEVETAEVGEVLMWMPGIGRSRVKHILGPTGVSRTLPLGDLSEKRRSAIVAQLQRFRPMRTG